MIEEPWTANLRAERYAATDALCAPHSMDWAVDGYLPAVGTTIWFGTGATGKTQLLLTLATVISQPRSNHAIKWLGANVNVSGRVLVLSAEDLRGELLRRLRGIVDALDLPDDHKATICSRIHILPFLSLSEAEFQAANPCLFALNDREWRPTSTLEEIERYIGEWNSSAPEEDRIVAIIMDSATTMAGFETTNSDATTNFLFYLNRLCVRLDLSWSIIGHTPKEVRVDPNRPQDNAIARLRGSAMWSTTPRSVIEVRLAHPDENLGDIAGVELGDLVVVTVAKANNFQAQRQPRYLKRLSGAGFEDVTALAPQNVARKCGKSEIGERDRARLVEVLGMLRELVARRDEARLSVKSVKAEFARRQVDVAAFAGMSGAPNERAEKTSVGSLAWCLNQIQGHGGLRYRNNGFDILDLGLAESRIDMTKD